MSMLREGQGKEILAVGITMPKNDKKKENLKWVFNGFSVKENDGEWKSKINIRQREMKLKMGKEFGKNTQML